MSQKPVEELIKQNLAKQGFIKDPMEENFLDMIQIYLFPNYKLLSFTNLIALIDTIFYISTLCYDDTDEKLGLLSPSHESLYTFGHIYPPKMKKGQYYRFIIPIFLYSNLIHYLFSMFAKIYLLQLIEHFQGFFKTLFIYLMVTTYGVVFNSLFPGAYGVGGSFFIGLILICFVQESSQNRMMSKYNQFCFISGQSSQVKNSIIIFITLLSIYVMNQVFPNIPMFGHCGSYFMSQILSNVFTNQKRDKNKCKQILWFMISILVYLATFYIFFFLKNNSE
ncbi:S54 family peptidase (macronuclear) [Tetrahymena thermophila SB210]|uniref:Rhomboid-like protease n=1 Tax=Tetrahymena thermophila (strain SB210) TaxID=312017 RepID=W7XJ99_TETTS|nr:S54 family peptidase [Tetrahymena thermophila SB210]EWS75331.1 S54 family peptidase [Tetrahymena thermophila SB210]|eukprot:XP_012652120.1 S54 family peptidase [Tetrahymena thermophila SB210]